MSKNHAPYNRVKISTTVPTSHADAVRQALGEAGAGQVGEYRFCSFSFVGTGRFLPSAQAHPHIGSPELLATVPEEHIEVVCKLAIAKQVLTALKQAHPYEEAIINIVPLLNETDLP